ncbi:MAG: HEPN domain-containing protein [Bacteroidia bacterium]|nr:HEPN domain-containing protein [Bacteroidia bacterium]
MKECSDDLIKYRITRSLETLSEAEIMMRNSYWNASVNRIYYSCYYAVSAILLKKSIETNSHKGIRQMFGLHFVQTGLVTKEDGRFFSDLYDRRQTGDYEDFVLYEEETVVKLFSQAKEFVERMIELLNKNDL